jgi:hypothetical protein
MGREELVRAIDEEISRLEMAKNLIISSGLPGKRKRGRPRKLNSPKLAKSKKKV